jgi:hypothetical protein
MKTSNANFKLYIQLCNRYLAKFNLGDYDVGFCHSAISIDGSECCGACNYQHDAKNAVIFLGKDWGAETITARTIERTALHEVLELLLSELIVIAHERSFSPDDLERAKHAVIQRIIHAMLGNVSCIINPKEAGNLI